MSLLNNLKRYLYGTPGMEYGRENLGQMQGSQGLIGTGGESGGGLGNVLSDVVGDIGGFASAFANSPVFKAFMDFGKQLMGGLGEIFGGKGL